MALIVSILTKSTPEQAYERLSGAITPDERFVRKDITAADVEAMIGMRNAGERWREIGEAFGLSGSGAHAKVKRYKNRA